MYLGVDVGGTKTLVALFDEKGSLKKSEKFPTPPNYDAFLEQLTKTVAKLSTSEYKMVCIAAPGTINRNDGILIIAPNLGWEDIALQADCEKLFSCPVLIENDAKLAGLYEAKNVINEFKKSLYITVSTGIGIALIVNGIIDVSIGDRGGNSMFMEHQGRSVSWESFASGKAIVSRYGKRASEITDKEIWQNIAQDIAVGLIELVAVLEPEVVIIGGGVGAHFEKFEKPLMKAMKEYETPLMPIPAIIKAKHAEEAVIHGCYSYIESHRAPAKK